MALQKIGLKKTALLILAVILYYAVLFMVFIIIRKDSIFPYPDFITGFTSWLKNMLPTLVMAVCDFLVIFVISDRFRFTKSLIVKIAADFAVTSAVMYALILIFVAVHKKTQPELVVDQAGIFMYNVLIVLSLEILYYIKRSKESLRREEAAKRAALQYRYEALKAQVNPHFLFNSLNILLTIIPEDRQKAMDFTVNLSKIYRYILTLQNRRTVALEEELDFLKSYIDILKIRYENAFFVDIQGTEHTSGKTIIPFTMQLLIENITKHNIVSGKDPMLVEICIGKNEITVTNSIKKKSAAGISTGIGLKYISAQYETAGKDFRVIDTGDKFSVRVPYI